MAAPADRRHRADDWPSGVRGSTRRLTADHGHLDGVGLRVVDVRGRTRPRGRSRRSVVRSIGQQRRAPAHAEQLGLAAVAPRAPIRCVATRRCTPVPASARTARGLQRLAVQHGRPGRPAASCASPPAARRRALRSRSRCSTSVAGRHAEPLGHVVRRPATSSCSSTWVPGSCSDRARSSNRLVSSIRPLDPAVHDLGADAARVRTSRPLSTSSWIARRIVGRDRPHRSARLISFSSRSPGASSPRSMAASIWRDDLEVERHRAGPVQVDGQLGHRIPLEPVRRGASSIRDASSQVTTVCTF